LVHEGGVTVERTEGGAWRFLRPDGREYQNIRCNTSTHDWSNLNDAHASQGLLIDSETAVTRWRGERMDYELGV
jgi:hypothetical protein